MKALGTGSGLLFVLPMEINATHNNNHIYHAVTTSDKGRDFLTQLIVLYFHLLLILIGLINNYNVQSALISNPDSFIKQ